MLVCFVTEAQQKTPTPITVLTPKMYSDWLAAQPAATKAWLATTQFRADAGAVRLLPNSEGQVVSVLCCVSELDNLWSVGHLPFQLPEGIYKFDQADKHYQQYAIAWGLGAYQFTRYKKPTRQAAKLFIHHDISIITNTVESIYQVRDMINTPTDDMGPTEFSHCAKTLAQESNAQFTEIIGTDLLDNNYASIYTVGRASDDAPRLVDIRWGDKSHPKITLVGKGVCFDSGGLDIKPSAYMLLMKKDMAGGAHVLGLARMIMQAKLPICLRVLVPMVENVISGNAYRPGDVIKSRKGLTIEVGNTDCEGRVILADALAEAVSEKPDLLIDMTTLTGAARIALGTELPAVFSNNDKLVADVIKHGRQVNDPMWQLPLYAPYREFINSSIADLNNNASESYGGAITAALFLKEFVPDDVPWLHLDMMAWNLRARPGRPQGAEAMTMRAIFSSLSETYTRK
jgi:leucyl aminopeptidase